ncbi:MAG: hypothetical protein KF823_06815 [Xanthomonadales bacterium]|nr:hypothetical protein [Xanthomonadales bacterium]
MTVFRTLLPFLLLAACGPLRADDSLRLVLASPDGRAVPASAPAACTGGLRNDDGSYEGAVGYANAVLRGSYVMAFDIPDGFAPARVCICWTRGPFNTGPDIDFELVFHAADGKGPKGEPDWPGTFLGRVTARAEGVPEFAVDGVALYPVELPEAARSLAGRIHVGTEWQPFVDRQFFLCNDAEVGGGTTRPVFEAYGSTNEGQSWSPVSPNRPTYRALGTVLFGDVLYGDGFDVQP